MFGARDGGFQVPSRRVYDAEAVVLVRCGEEQRGGAVEAEGVDAGEGVGLLEVGWSWEGRLNECKKRREREKRKKEVEAREKRPNVVGRSRNRQPPGTLFFSNVISAADQSDYLVDSRCGESRDRSVIELHF